MMKKRAGAIINLSSVVGLIGNVGQCNYAASKAGVLGFTKAVAREVAPRGITCNAIAPGFIKTDMTNELNDKVKEQMEGQIPLKKLRNGRRCCQCSPISSSKRIHHGTGIER